MVNKGIKKVISFIFVIILLLSLASVAAAKNEDNGERFCSYKLYIDSKGKTVNFLHNEFYDIFADYYVEKCFNCYMKDKENQYYSNLISENLYNTVKENDDVTYLVVILKSADNAADIREKTGYCEFENDYCAYKEKVSNIGELDELLKTENLEYITLFAPDCDLLFVNELVFREEFTPTATDARKILRYSAGLDKAPADRGEAKEFLFMSDTDLDGKITAADARTALRISAKRFYPFGDWNWYIFHPTGLRMNLAG